MTEPAPARLAPGGRFGRYEVLQRLGFGGMAEVYKAHDPALDRFVALKVILPHLASDPEFALRFATEARLAARLSHPNVVTIYEIDMVDGQQFLTMQFVPGPTLAGYIARSGALPPATTLSILSQIGAALDHAHQAGVIHRDLKPANILLDTDNSRALLADFGIAKAADASARLTRTGGTMGTASYMAPEQVTDEAPMGPAVDRYALGIVAYELLCGRVPFTAPRPTGVMFKHAYEPVPPIRQFNPQLSPAVESVLIRALAKKPEERYPTASAFVLELRKTIEVAPAPLAPPVPEAATVVIDRVVPPEPTPVPVAPPPEPTPPLTPTPAVAPAEVAPTPPPPTTPPGPRKNNLVLVLALVFGFVVIAVIALLAILGASEPDEPDPVTPVAAGTPRTPVAAGTPVAPVVVATPVPSPSSAAQAAGDPVAAVTASLRSYYDQHGVDPRTLRTRLASSNPAQTGGVVEVNYPVTVNQTTNGVDWSIETNAIDAWQVERDNAQQWSLGKQTSNKYVGGVSASDALAAVQAVLKYDQAEPSAMRTLNASLLAPVVTPAYAREVQARFDSLRKDGITSVVESLSSAKFCRFTQDSPRAISVSVDEVWSHIAYSRGQVVSQELLEHNPQVTHVALQGTSWLLDGNDTEDLPADFPAACRG